MTTTPEALIARFNSAPQRVADIDSGELADEYRISVSASERVTLIAALSRPAPTSEQEVMSCTPGQSQEHSQTMAGSQPKLRIQTLSVEPVAQTTSGIETGSHHAAAMTTPNTSVEAASEHGGSKAQMPKSPVANDTAGADVEPLFIRSKREGGYTFVTAPKFPGFSVMLRPNEDDTRLNVNFVAFLPYVLAEPLRPAPAAEVTAAEIQRLRAALGNIVRTEVLTTIEQIKDYAKAILSTPSPDAGRVPKDVALRHKVMAHRLRCLNKYTWLRFPHDLLEETANYLDALAASPAHDEVKS